MRGLRITRREFAALLPGAAGALALAAACSTSERSATASPVVRYEVAYGADPQQRGDLRARQDVGAQPLVVLVHGGYWKVGLHRAVMDSLASDLASRGWASWNIDYRRVGDPGGGWPGTLEDIAAALDYLADLPDSYGLDLERVAIIGHSAGAQLAFWAAGRAGLPSGAPGSDPRVVPAAAVSLSGVLDLVAAADLTDPEFAELTESTVAFLGGGPGVVPDRYGLASPTSLVPIGGSQLVLHGTRDEKVPVSQSDRFAELSEAAGGDVELVLLPEVDHFDVIKREYVWWSQVLRWLPSQIGNPP